jgi:Flp pilus assembly protein TadB
MQDTSSTTQTYTTLANDLQTYRNYTFSLNNFNEIYATNKYLEKSTDDEKERLVKSLDQLRSSLLRMHQEYLIKKRKVEEYKVRISILHWTMIAICAMFLLIAFVLMGKIGQNLMVLIVIIVIVVYALIVTLVIRSNSYRYDTNWKMYHWGPVEEDIK